MSPSVAAVARAAFRRRTYVLLRNMLRAERAFWQPEFRRSVRIAQDALDHGASQKVAELAPLLALLARRPPRTVLEIGSASGGTLYAWCQVAAPDATIVSVDLPGGAFGGGYSEDDAARISGYARPGQRLCLLRLDSHDPAALDAVSRELGSRPLDFLMIDGDHTYDGVKQDFEMYSPLAGPGSLVAFHDIAEHTELQECEVHRLWAEIRERKRSWEFFDPTDIRSWGPWGGIGILVW